MKILRITVVCLIGAFGGAFLGATLLGVATYTNQGVDYFGRPGRDWSRAAAIAGAIFGFAPGLFLGLAVAGNEYRRVTAALHGLGIGLVVAFPATATFLISPELIREAKDLLFVVAPIPVSGLLGVVLSILNEALRAFQKSSQAKKSLIE